MESMVLRSKETGMEGTFALGLAGWKNHNVPLCLAIL